MSNLGPALVAYTEDERLQIQSVLIQKDNPAAPPLTAIQRLIASLSLDAGFVIDVETGKLLKKMREC